MVSSWRAHHGCWRGRQGSAWGKAESRGDQGNREDGGRPEVTGLDSDGGKGGGIELEMGREEGERELNVEVGAGGLGGGPASPMGELIRCGPKLNESGGATAAEGVPSDVGEDGAQGAIEGVCGGNWLCGEIGTEEVEPLADEGGCGAPAEQAVTLGRVESDTGGTQGGRCEGGGLTDAEEINEGHKE